MAGSRKFHKYTANNGSVYAIDADESNVEDTQGEGNDITDNAIQELIPRNIKPRYATYKQIGGLKTIKVPVLTPAYYTLMENGDGTGDVNLSFTRDTIQYALQSVTPERRRLIGGFDTQQDDGDAS